MNYANRARTYITADVLEIAVAEYLLGYQEQPEIIIARNTHKNTKNTIYHQQLFDEAPNNVVVHANVRKLLNGSYFGITLKRCEEDGPAELIYIPEESIIKENKNTDKKEINQDYSIPETIDLKVNEKKLINGELLLSVNAWSAYINQSIGSEKFIKDVRKTREEMRHDVKLQKDYERWQSQRYPNERIEWMVKRLEDRADPKNALKLCAKIAEVNITNEDNEKWNALEKVRPAYREAVALTQHKNIDRYRNGMKVMTKLWEGVREERIAYAKINGVHHLGRNSMVEKSTIEHAREAMFDGRMSIHTMKTIGDGYLSVMYSYLESEKIKKGREDLQARTLGR